MCDFQVLKQKTTQQIQDFKIEITKNLIIDKI